MNARGALPVSMPPAMIHRSTALKVGGAFFEEGADAFFVVLGFDGAGLIHGEGIGGAHGNQNEILEFFAGKSGTKAIEQ